MRAKRQPRRRGHDFQRVSNDPQGDRLSRFAELQAARERVERRRLLHAQLVDTARRLSLLNPDGVQVHAVLPEVDDPLVLCETLREEELDFPIGAEEFWATWRIGLVRDPPVVPDAVYEVSESETDD